MQQHIRNEIDLYIEIGLKEKTLNGNGIGTTEKNSFYPAFISTVIDPIESSLSDLSQKVELPKMATIRELLGKKRVLILVSFTRKKENIR